jgi:PAS domain S-box-containing protein
MPTLASEIHDPARLATLHGLGLPDAPADAAFDRLTRLVVRTLGVPAAFVSLVDGERHVCLSQHGLGEPPAPVREQAGETLCRQVLRSGGERVVGDTRIDAAGGGVPMVEALGVAAYVGIPLRLPEGAVIGCFCAIDVRPRAWSDAEVELLRDVAAVTLSEIALRREREDRREGEEHYRRRVDAAPEAILVHRGGEILYANPAALHLFGAERPEQLVGTPVIERVAPDGRAAVNGRIQRVVPGGEAAPVLEGRLLRLGGGSFAAETVGTPIPFAGGPAVQVVVRDLTERLRAEAHYRRVVTSSPFAIYVLDGAGAFVEINPAGERFLGRTAAELVGTSLGQVVDAGSREAARRAFSQALSGAGADVQVELEVVQPSGERVRLALTASAILADDGAVGVHGIARDITQERLAERTLRESEQKFQQLAANVREVFWIFSADFSETVYVSPAFEEVWGLPLSVVYADPTSFVYSVHPDDQATLLAGMADVSNHPVGGTEYRVIRPDGTVRWVCSRGFPVLDDEGRMYRVVGTTEDITHRKEAEAAIRANERRMRQVLDALPVGILLAEADGRLVWHNPAGDRIWGGIRMVDLDGYREYEGWWTETGDPIQPHEWGMARALRGEPSAGELVDLQGFDGVRRTVRHSGVPLRGEDGEITGALIVLEDVTRARETETQRRTLAAALEGLPDGVCLATDAGEILYANRAFAEILGFDPEGDAPRLTELAADAESELATAEALRTAGEQGRWSGRIRKRRLSDGREVPLEALLGRVEQGGRGPGLLFGIIRDISAQLSAEQHLRRAERLASIGTLLGGVAHELNNPLSAVLGFTELLLMQERPREEREDLETIRREAERMAKIVTDLRLLARDTQEKTDGRRERVDLNDVVQHVLRTRAYSLRTRNVEVRAELAADLPAVLADRGQMEQVVLNLVVNAEQALALAAGEAVLVVRTRATAAGASLQVADSGPGIPASHLERVFDPFFTTKAPGEGTGLGLSLAHTIVSEHGGQIRVDSQPGQGATFQVDLPRAAGRAGIEAGGELDEAAVAPLRVLLVDDEDAVRRVVARFLRRRGHHVDEAADGRAALGLIEAARAEGRYDVIVSDLRMPGLGGDELLARLREDGEGMDRRLIFFSGDTASVEAVRALAASRVPVLAKPVSMNELARAVEGMPRE